MCETIEQEIFRRLDDWRHLPKYQLERRADIFFAIYLKEILNKCLKDKPSIDLVIPEFPIRKSKNNYRTWNIDYLCISENKFYFVELKTDIKSIDIKQYKRMKKVIGNNNIEDLIEDIITIKEHSAQWKKYNYLLEKLNNVIKFTEEEIQKSKSNSNNNIEINDFKLEDLIIYILPSKESKNRNKNLDKLKTDEENNEIKIITFDDVRETLEEILPKNAFLLNFIESLKKWENSAF